MKSPCRPLDVINYMKIHHGVNVSYDKTWRRREIAFNSIKGTPEDSYAMLSAFSDALIRNNPGTYTAEEADDVGWFKFYFMALDVSIDAWNYCVLVISVDGAAKKNKYLENGFNVDFEVAEHGLCAFHLLKNLKKNHKSLSMEDSFNKCVRAYTALEFEYYMRQLEQLSPLITHELEAVGRHR
ncbi:uncharacterized protein E5676_scaffold108G00680 [Cucumis melo var. makuwa]|uniref:Uncharacterized protein n=1 Tax=Cucumis melo var. makuwa TaxID=1194695 RepID=A0A5D3C1V8_CUCMM|nr:uncharacterized protein E6C27_scaffold226G00080 [Cucumis melo var. makuwa]TYK05254.1 uncharacterized protein E5676_scaffold108G00680 [Cucumis melo var. makuwa]